MSNRARIKQMLGEVGFVNNDPESDPENDFATRVRVLEEIILCIVEDGYDLKQDENDRFKVIAKND